MFWFFRSRLALKLTNGGGYTSFGGGYTSLGGCKIKVGKTVTRTFSWFHKPISCSKYAVHAYETLEQAKNYDEEHCSHGPSGTLWLVRLYGLSHYMESDKLAGRKYKVLERLGSLSEVTQEQVDAAMSRWK